MWCPCQIIFCLALHVLDMCDASVSSFPAWLFVCETCWCSCLIFPCLALHVWDILMLLSHLSLPGSSCVRHVWCSCQILSCLALHVLDMCNAPVSSFPVWLFVCDTFWCPYFILPRLTIHVWHMWYPCQILVYLATQVWHLCDALVSYFPAWLSSDKMPMWGRTLNGKPNSLFSCSSYQ